VCLVHRVPLVVEQDPFVGTVVAGRYRIEGVIGAGGMATVYRALSTLHERAVAIKLFRKELASDPKLRERFRREASSTRRLAHRNVVEIVDEGALDDGTPFLVMEYLEGKTLEAILRGNRGPLEIGRTVDLGLQLAAGLARAHDFQVLHRDLKPDNLFIVPLEDGAELLKILDFGIARSMNDARLTATGEIFGTPQYMAPERITTTESGPAADLYAVGCILFRCAVGRLPFVAGDVTSFLLQHLREPPPSPRALNPAVPPELDALILQCLQKDPARRPVDAHAIERALTELHGQHARQHPSGAFPAAELVNTARARAKALSATTVGGLFSADAVQRWGRRTDLLGQMLARAHPSVAPVALSAAVGRMRATVTAMHDVQARWVADQTRADAVAQRTKEAQERFGRAMDALAQDLSQARQSAQQGAELTAQHEAHVGRLAEAFRPLHAAVLAVGPDAAPDTALRDRYAAALAALEPIAEAGDGLGKARAWQSQRDAEVRDLEYQIEMLRAQLTRASQTGEDEERAIQSRLQSAAAQLTQMEAALVRDATELTTALRGRRELDTLFRAFEADAG
jgi:tRNA A-37 threonylcarbamoyl transferase component Bud32